MITKGDIVFLGADYVRNGFSTKNLRMYKVDTLLKNGDVLANEIIGSINNKLEFSENYRRFNYSSLRKQ